MLNKVKTLAGYTLHSLDGEIGKVKEFYFDDQHWAVRYLVADTGTWLSSRQVLISPYALAKVNTEQRSISVDLTRKQIEDSPSLETDKPVSRQFEEGYYGYFGWPIYWSGPYMWGDYPNLPRDFKNPSKPNANIGGKVWNSHLRSTFDVDGHIIQALDGEIGHVEDFIVDDENWAIRYLIINTRNWWPGKKVLISPQWIVRVSWASSKVFVNLSRDTVRESPEYTDNSLLTRDYEVGLHGHYNREGYWIAELAAHEQVR